MKKNIELILFSILIGLYLSFHLNGILKILLVIFIPLIFFIYKKYNNEVVIDKKNIILSIISTLFISISDSCILYKSIFNKNILFYISIIGLFYFIIFSYSFLNYFFKKKYNLKFIPNTFKKNPFLFSFICMLIIYGIYLISFYPGIINFDNANQIKEAMGLHTRYLDSIIPISTKTYTNFNPIIHTMILGGFFKLGYKIGSVNLGLFLYTIFQMLIVIIVNSYTINYLNKKKYNIGYIFLTLIFLLINPIFGFYSITAVKDVLYTSFLIVFITKLIELINNNYSKKNIIETFIFGMLTSLFRNNGIIIVIACLLYLFISNKNKKCIYLVGLISGIYILFTSIFLPFVGVNPTSIRETLSVPFQAIARVVKYHEDDISYEDKIIIGNILNYDTLKKDYNPVNADSVKNKFNIYYTNEDLFKFIIVYIKYFFKHPLTYFNALFNNISGYISVNVNNWKIYSNLNLKLPQAGFDYHYIDSLSIQRDLLIKYMNISNYLPIGYISNIGVLFFITIYIFININRKYKVIILPSFISIIFCYISAVNSYYRFVYPVLLMMIILFPIYKTLQEDKTK